MPAAASAAAAVISHTPYGCRIDAIDLTPQFVAAAERLNALCGLVDKIAMRAGSVTDLPYDDGCFDHVWSQNVTMNVADKRRMFAEAYRVLKPGGRFSFSHLARGPAGEPYYPLPWAMDASYSFLGTPQDILQGLRDAGFAKVENRSEVSAPGTRPPNDFGAAIVMGADMPQRQANAARSVKDDWCQCWCWPSGQASACTTACVACSGACACGGSRESAGRSTAAGAGTRPWPARYRRPSGGSAWPPG